MLRQYICWAEGKYSPYSTGQKEIYYLHQIHADEVRFPEGEPKTCKKFLGIASFLKEQRPKDREGKYGRIILYSAKIGDDISRAPRLYLREDNSIIISGRLHETEELKGIGKCLVNMLENPAFPG